MRLYNMSVPRYKMKIIVIVHVSEHLLSFTALTFLIQKPVLVCHVYAFVIVTDTQTVNFTLRSTLLNIDFGLVVDGVTFYDCSVRDK